MYKNIIFDFDGVIINSHEVQIKALTESFKQVCGSGVPPYDDFFKLSGDSLKNIFMQIGLPVEMIPIYQKTSRENIHLIKIHEGIKELLNKLNEFGYICSLCTGKERIRTIEILKLFKMENYFKTVVCSNDVVYPKPHPESLLKIIETIGATKESTVMVGDGINDILAANNAGIKSIAVTWGDSSVESLLHARPSMVARSVLELRSLLLLENISK